MHVRRVRPESISFHTVRTTGQYGTKRVTIMRMNTTRTATGTLLRGLGLAACLAAAISMSACESTGTGTAAGVDSTAPSPTSTPSAASATPSVTPPPSDAASAASAAASSSDPSASPTATKASTKTTVGFYDAQAAWKKGATEPSSTQGVYWQKAITALQSGKTSDPGDTSYYPTAITLLKQLIKLPDAQQTAAQNAEFKTDVMTLDGFFQTPGLYQ